MNDKELLCIFRSLHLPLHLEFLVINSHNLVRLLPNSLKVRLAHLAVCKHVLYLLLTVKALWSTLNLLDKLLELILEVLELLGISHHLLEHCLIHHGVHPAFRCTFG